MPRGTLRAGGAVEAGRWPRPRVPRTAPGRRGSGAPPGRDAGPTPTAAVARSKARRKSGAARRRRGLATAAREAPAGLERAPARCRFIGRAGALQRTFRVTREGKLTCEGHITTATGGRVPPGRHLGPGHPVCLILAGGRRDISHSVRGLLGRPKGRVRAGFALISKTLQNGVRWVGGLSRPSTVGTVGTYQYGTVGAIATEELRL